MYPTLLTAEGRSDFRHAYTKLSGLDIPEEYLVKADVYGFYQGDELKGGFILNSNGPLRTIELFAQAVHRPRIYQQLKKTSNVLEVTCFWLRRDYRKQRYRRSLAWIFLAREIIRKRKTYVIYGTNKTGLAKLYDYPRTSTLLHRDEVRGKVTFIFIATRKGFYNIYETAFVGLLERFRKKERETKVKPQLLDSIINSL